MSGRCATSPCSCVHPLEPRRLLSRTIYVDLNAPGPTHDGSSWASAFANLQPALALAAAGDEVRVADGAFSPGTNLTDTFNLKNGVELLGGYAGFGAATPDARDPLRTPTVLRGPNVSSSIGRIDYAIVTASAVDATTQLDGFTISPTQPADPFSGSALGLSCTNASPHVQNCTFSGLASACVVRYGSPTFVDCSFSRNQATYGGAMYIEFSSVTAVGCSFTENKCIAVDGGAVFANHSNLAFTECTFVRNRDPNNSGGAIAFRNGTAEVQNCFFYANSSIDPGGAIEAEGNLSVVNCAFVANHGGDGGAINASSGSVEVRRSTFTMNSGFFGGAVVGRATEITGSIFWNDSAYSEGGELSLSGNPDVIGNDIRGGWSGSGGSQNIDADPQFIRNPSPGADGNWGTADDDYGDLRLQFYSPCIDVGFDDGYDDLSTAKDLAGNPRVVDFPGVAGFGDEIDMGAYETPAALIVQSAGFNVDAPKPQLQFKFNSNLDLFSLNAGDLALTNLTSGQLIGTYDTTVRYDAATRTATWSLPPALLADGNYRAALFGGAVRDTAGRSLAVSFNFNFFMLAGDANRDRIVDVGDLGILATNWQGTGKTFSQGDFNYDGKVDVGDLAILASGWQKTLPPAAPASPTSLPNSPQFPAATARRTHLEGLADDILE
jgi:hypothetical protein